MCTCVFLALKKKNEQHESRKIAGDTAFQMLITLRNCSKEVGEGKYTGDFGEWVNGEFGEWYMQNQEHIFTEGLIRVSASPEEQTSS